jgi:hypothetical protein
VWIALILCVWSAAALAAPAPQPKTPKEEPCAVEIDFSPLASAPETVTRYKLHLSARSESGETYKDTYKSIGPVSLTALVGLAQESFEGAGWKVKMLGDHKMIVEGYKGSPVVHFELKAEGLPEANIPVSVRPTAWLPGRRQPAVAWTS